MSKQRRLESQRPVAGPPLPGVAGRAPEVRLRKDLAVFFEIFRPSAFVSHTRSEWLFDRDGNGRVARLATTLLLHSHGFQVSRYISLERMVEESQVEYYRVLGECSREWHEGKNEILPWWNYLLSLIRAAYKEFETQVESSRVRPAKSDLASRTVLAQVEEFTLADLSAQMPSASRQLIKKGLSGLNQCGKVRLVGRGRGARWLVGGH